jgi:hypothetical protein
MDISKFKEEGTKQLASLQAKLVSKGYLVEAIKDKMQGIDRAKNYSKWKAYAECLVLVEEAKEH